MKHPEERQASRLILIDELGRILLFQYARRNGERFWSTPGGGVEAGETFEEAALREAYEELGLSSVGVTFLWEDVVELIYIDRPVLQKERFFRIDGNVSDPLRGVEKAHQAEGILNTKWWTLAEIESAKEPVFPEALAHRIRELV